MGILSIGIATFERGYLAEKRLIELNKISIDNQIEIYIIDNNSQDIFNYVYLLQKFDINENKFIYKFGKTSRDFQKRLKEHGREAKILMVLDIENCSFCETQVLNSLKSDPNIKHCKNIGNEYFSCDNKRYIVQKITKILS